MQKLVEMRFSLWYNVARHYTSASSLSTNGRKFSEANCAHAPQGTCSKEHGIMLIDYYIGTDSFSTRGKYT